MCCYLDNFGARIGARYPRLWLYLGEYKNAAKIIAIIVVFLQVVRIVMVGLEAPFVYNAYQDGVTIGFCGLSIFLGVTSLGLECLLIYAIQKTNIKKIQPWFLCTVIIFLIASLAFVITSTLYIVRPLDHNSSRYRFKHSFPNDTTLAGNNETGLENSPLQMMNSSKNSAEECTTNTNNSKCTAANTDNQNSIQQVAQNSSSATTLHQHHFQQQLNLNLKNLNLTWKDFRNILTGQCPKKDKPKCKVRVYIPDMVDYLVKPALPLSFLLDVVRCLPQLFFVNRFVKAEQLHEHFMHQSHSHTSLSALYVKPSPVIV